MDEMTIHISSHHLPLWDFGERMVVASLRKMKRDYDCFPDVVTPFAAGLSHVNE